MAYITAYQALDVRLRENDLEEEWTAVKKIAMLLTILFVSVVAAEADNLYRVTVQSHTDAATLKASGLPAVARVKDGFLVVGNEREAEALSAAGLKTTLAAADVSRDRIALDRRLDRWNVNRLQLLFEEDNLRLYRLPAEKALPAETIGEIIPTQDRSVPIIYTPPLTLNPDFNLAPIDLDSLIGLVVQDSLYSYTSRLQAFYRRYNGTDSCHAARDWIAAKFASFGYDSIVIDSFVGSVSGQNVVAVKVGGKYPERQIVIGGHYDGVAVSPAADDNGSGTAGTLEMARILKDIETDMTFIFIAFDGEEEGLWGSNHYSSMAAARGDNIVYMLNMDMIAHLTNTTMAKLYYGPVIAYSQLWGRLADSLVGITGVLSGTSGGSDHVGFIEEGYAATFVHEFNFSTVYHSVRDSTIYMNFDYMTKMVQASLATVYSVNYSLPPVVITAVRDVGDGQSLDIAWSPIDPSEIDHYQLFYTTVPATQPESLLVPKDSSRYMVGNLTENQEYSFYIIAYSAAGSSSLAVHKMNGTPRSIPQAPENIAALPLKAAIRVSWTAANTELDFSHYAVMRDDVILPDTVNDSVYIDDDPSLGTTLHEYRIRAVDADGNMSDTAGIAPAIMKAAVLEAGRILAVNRTSKSYTGFADRTMTGTFLNDALHGLNFDYYPDSFYYTMDILDMIDYGLLVLGGESIGSDFFGQPPELAGIIRYMSYYLSIGGKIIIFGRWGDVYIGGASVDTAYFTPGLDNFAYTEYFNIAYQVQPLSYLYSDGGLNYTTSDFVGAHSHMAGYPDLVWDSVLTIQHTGTLLSGTSGIPGPSFAVLAGAPIDTLYTYDSRNDSVFTEGQVIGWRSLGGPYEYVFLELPLSFMAYDAAEAALRQAVSDMGISTAVGDQAEPTPLPDEFALLQNYPNPFNPSTTIAFNNPESRPVKATVGVYNILGQLVRQVFDGLAQPGLTRVVWDGRDEQGREAASGIYFYRLKTEQSSLARKMVLLK